MKLLLSLSLSLFIILCGAPSKVRADAATGNFALPDGRVAEAYQTDIEAVLRDRYRLKVETGVRESILQWFLFEGELPPGLTVRTDGRVAGTPKTFREQPYQFRVKVIDQAVNGSEPLVITLSIAVAAARLRLTSIEGPALVPLDNASQPGSAGPRDASATGQEVALVGSSASAATVSAVQSRVIEHPLTEASGANESADSSTTYRSTPLTRRGSGGRGVLAKVTGVLGFRQNGAGGAPVSTSKPKGCAQGSNAHRVISDEAHTPLEGDTSTQSTCVEFTNLNTLKYWYEFNEKRTSSAGPDISTLPFLPKVSLTATTGTTGATTPAVSPSSALVDARLATMGRMKPKEREDKAKTEADKLGDELRALSIQFDIARAALTRAEGTLRKDVEQKINDNAAAVQDAHQASIRLANAADLYLQSNNETGLLNEVDTVKGTVDSAMKTEWPSNKITEVLNALDDATKQLEDIRVKKDDDGKIVSIISQEAWKEWLAANEGRYNRVRDRITELKNKVNDINKGADAFNERKNRLAGWQLMLDNVQKQREAAFRQSAFVSCHTDEGESQSSKLTLSKTDRMAANQSATSRDVLTVSCYSRVAVTAGFNFSTLDEREFSVVQSAGSQPGTTVKKFGFTSRSSFRPNPLALVNIRFTDNPVINWHASFGAVVDLKGQTGTDVEPVAGVSFSLRRLIFITPFALHFGRVNKLAGGFTEGDTVPDSIATPPLEKAWKIGYTAGITFRIAPQ